MYFRVRKDDTINLYNPFPNISTGTPDVPRCLQYSFIPSFLSLRPLSAVFLLATTLEALALSKSATFADSLQVSNVVICMEFVPI